MKRSFLKWYCFSICIMCCTLALKAQNTTFAWAKQYAGTVNAFDVQGSAVVVDKAGYVYTTGYFQDTVDFGAGPAVHRLGTLNTDMYMTKHDATGNLIWVKQVSGNNSSRGFTITTDNKGYIYVAGVFTNTEDFDPGPGVANLVSTKAGNATSADIFVAKYDTAGNYQWADKMGGPKYDAPHGIAVDGQGNVYTTGSFTRTADFDPGPGTFNMTANLTGSVGIADLLADIFVSKLDASGNFVWAKQMGGGVADIGESIALDGLGHIYTTGYFASANADFDPGTGVYTLVPTGGQVNQDIYVSKLDTAGNFIWAKQMGGTSDDQSYGIALDSFGHIFTTGYFSNYNGGSIADFDPGTGTYNLTATSDENTFISKLDTAGNFVWARQIAGGSGYVTAGYNQGNSITVDYKGAAYITGYFQDSLVFDPHTGNGFLSAGDNDIFIHKVDSAGNFAWAKQIGGTLADVANSIALDSARNVYITGTFNDKVDFNPDTASTAVYDLTALSVDMFVERLSTVCTASNTPLTATACYGSYTLNNQVYTASGVYTQKLVNQDGCDSIITLTLTLDSARAVINVNSFVLGVTLPFATYQWYQDGKLITGATDSVYTVTANGSYTVVVTNANGCTDTADAYPVSNVGINNISLTSKISIAPNPASDFIYITAPVKVDATLIDMQGRIIKQLPNATKISLSQLAPGIYMLRITDQAGQLLKTEKIVKSK